MARERYREWGLVEMAGGPADPVWPLPTVTPKFADWSFGGGRPFNCSAGDCVRWHAGIDLVGAKDKAIVVATERMEIVSVDKNWSAGSRHVTGRTDTGLFLVFGGTAKGSGDEWGIRPGVVVEPDDPIGRVLGSYGMIHFETYAEQLREGIRETNTPWPIGQPPPDGLQNPLNYIERAAGREMSLGNWPLRRAALRKLGFGPADSGVWGQLDIDALIEAQAALAEQSDTDIEVDGIWGPKTDAAIRRALGSDTPLVTPAKPTPPTGSPPREVPAPAGSKATPNWQRFIVPALIGAAVYAGYRLYGGRDGRHE